LRTWRTSLRISSQTFAALSLACGLAARAFAVDATITTLSGDQVTAGILAISNGALSLAGGENIQLDDIRRFDFAPAPAAGTKNPETLFLACGSQLLCQGASLNDEEEIEAELLCGTDAVFSIDAVRGIRFLPARPRSLFAKGLEAAGQETEDDRVYVPKESELRELSGILKELSAELVALHRGGNLVELRRPKVHGVIFAAALSPDMKGLNAKVHLNDGSILKGRIVEWKEDVLSLQMIEDASVRLPASCLKQISIRSARLAYASEMEPASSSIQPILAPRREWQKDKNVLGLPLVVGKQTFEKGLGMAAGTRIRWDLSGKFAKFTAVLGIDAGRAGKGDCEAVVTADGREIFRQRLRGGEKAISLTLDIGDADELSLAVEPGEDYDLSDHVNWCEAAFVKK